MKRLSALFFMSLWTVILLAGCDAIPGMGSEPAPVAQPAPPPVAPMPGQPIPVAPVPGQPMPVAPVPGQPVPVAPVPGQPVPVAPVPGQPVGVPPATPIPGQPVAPVPVQPVVMVPPTPTGDALTDKLNTKKFQIASAFIPTSAMVKQTLKKGKTQDYQVQLPGPPYCHTFVAVAADAVGNLDVAVESPAGVVEATDTTQDTSPAIFNHCPVAPGLYKVKVSMPKKGGEFALQAFSK